MRMKATLELVLICGAALAICGRKEPAMSATFAAAALIPVQTSTLPAITTVAAAAELENALSKCTFANVCSMRHATGIAGAPKPGDKADQRPHTAQGKGASYKHALKGFNSNKGAMLVRGGSASPDGAIKTAVDYMMAGSQ